MKFALFGSTGAALMSLFHQLSGGKSGSGAGSAPLRSGCALMVSVAKRNAKAKRRMSLILRRFIVTSVFPVTAANLSCQNIVISYNLRGSK